MNDQPKYGFWPLVIPFLTFILLTMLEPSFGNRPQRLAEPDSIGQVTEQLDSQQLLPPHDFEVRRFLLIYGIKILITSAVIIFFFRFYLDQFPWSISALAIPVGLVGIVLWVAISQLELEQQFWTWLGLGNPGRRSEFNPFDLLSDPVHRFAFFGLRFFGLVVVVPICEELFLRGFLMRIIENPQWWTVRLSELGTKTLLVAPLYGAITHPEIVAAIVWFSLVTWLMKRTGKFWDCVVAHAVTNLMLGVYVITFGQWQLW